MNEVQIEGGVVRDPSELKDGGVRLVVAVNKVRWDSGTKADVIDTVYVRVTALGAVADAVLDLKILKGDKVFVIGQIDQTAYERKDGTTERKTGVEAKMVSMTRRSFRAPDQEEPF